jgi:hypothetical protein
MTESSVISKVLETEIAKKILTTIFGRLEKAIKSNSSQREANDVLDSILPVSDEDKQAIFDKVSDRYLTFRTLMSRDRDVFIDDIYHPLRISKDNDIDNSVTITQENQFEFPKIACIIGKAGQGKTTILRKLFLNHILGDSGQFPLIITLRKIDWTDNKLTVPTIISDEFKSLGIIITPEACSYLLQLDRLKILFDGFDEVEAHYRGYALRIITDTHVQFRSKCIVTTRPGTEIHLHGGEVHSYWLMDLLPEDVIEIITNHPFVEKEDKNQLLRVINTKKDIASILLTPIIVDIFISTYNSLIADPTSIIDFYEQLFQSLSSSHDRLKILYTRTGKSNLTNKQLEKVFWTASYKLINIRNDISFRENELISAFDFAAKKLALDADNVHIDVIDKTSLIKQDGHEYSYIHKSIIEFHAAKHILNLSDDTRKEYYIHILDNYRVGHENILRYLSKMDTDLFYITFVKGLLNKIDGLAKLLSPKMRNVVTKHLFLAHAFFDTIHLELKIGDGTRSFVPKYNLENESRAIASSFRMLFSILDITPPNLFLFDINPRITAGLICVEINDETPFIGTTEDQYGQLNSNIYEIGIEKVLDFQQITDEFFLEPQLMVFFDSIHALNAEVDNYKNVYTNRNTSLDF